MQSRPVTPLPSMTFPASSTTAGCTPRNGSEAEPGFMSFAPGRPVIMWPPVSVCQYVSTTEQRSPPTTLWYQRHASGLIGSPTLPSTRRLSRL